MPLLIMIIVGLIALAWFKPTTSSRNRRTKSGKGPEPKRHVIVKHRGQLKHYRINKYGELYEK